MLDLWDRYRAVVVLAGIAVGMVLVVLDRQGPPVFRDRTLGLNLSAATLISVLLGSVRPVPGALTAILAVAPADDDARAHPLGPWVHLLAVASLVGVWASVPDVEPALAAGSCLALIAVSRAQQRRSPGVTGTVVLVVMVVGSAVIGSAGRAAAVAAAAAVGQVLVAPLVDGMGDRPLPGRAIGVLAVVHLLVAVPVGREVYGLAVPAALAIALASLGINAVAALAVSRIRPGA